MGRPHPALIEIAAGRRLPSVIHDPDALLASAQEHRMAGLLGQRLSDGATHLPAAHMRRIAAFNLGVRAHHRRLWDALDDVTRRLQQIGVEVASFKGVTAEARWYDGLGQRPSIDIDLLLPPHQLDRIDDVIGLIQPQHRLAGVAKAMSDMNQLQHVDLQWGADATLDVHFDLLKILVRGRHSEEIWSRTTMFAAPGLTQARVIDPEASLIQLLLHLTKDRFPFLLGFVDVVRIVERAKLDWDYIDRFLTEEGLDATAYLALDSVFRTLNLPLPEGMPVVRGLHRPVWALLWGPRTQLLGRSGRLTHHRRQFLIPLLARGRRREGIRRLWQLLFPPRELMDHFHPHTRGPYLLRLVVGRRRRALQRRQRASRARAGGEDNA